ncbi:exodeoxyribonuclease III [uncultured Dysosmobacter sp.]|uniref:exodeoxyribonuclease III n=1 Tax=uncultured Dysosmobacter sp. TaxID=2591384 RepID=UPI00261AC9FA|nr:exodeoxyribonuclease III [uncultured Dysosmobacter sp.]
MKITTWNVNGIAACRRKGFLRFLADTRPDILCCQEIKSQCELNTPGYNQVWNPAKRSGYSGSLVLTRRQPRSITLGFDADEDLDAEGRLIALEYADYYVVSVYVPNTNPHSDPTRPEYRARWEAALRKYIKGLDKPAILCGDFNVAHTDLDIYPEHEKGLLQPLGFEQEERERFNLLLSCGYVDAFRALHPTKEGVYTWWSPKNHNREANRGCRLDYFLLSNELVNCVQSVSHHVNTVASDHCPVSMVIRPAIKPKDISNEDLAVMWHTIDWPKMEDALYQKQINLAEAAHYRDWSAVSQIQTEIVHSFAAKVLAVRNVVNMDGAAGVDNVKWSTPAQMMQAALSLTSRGYHPLPYRHHEIADSGHTRIVHIPAARDKAMMALYAFSLDPVAESTADHGSFSARRGRSALDLHAYLSQELSGPDAPGFIAIVDVKAYYSSIVHERLLTLIPMDKTMLRKFLQAGVVRDGQLFETDQGISLGTSLSPILGNMLLDGLQSYLYDHLFPEGHKSHDGGRMFRFADDIAVTARDYKQAAQIMEIIGDFLADRGLKINHDKSFIASLRDGFDFLARHYRVVKGILEITPSTKSIQKIERELSDLILGHNGSLRTLIDLINKRLNGWATYHRITDAYMVFRHVDAVVEGLLVRRMCDRYSRWHRDTVLNKFWIKEDGYYVFALPDDPTVRVTRLAPITIVRHKPCRLSTNSYLDNDYYAWLKYKRDTQKNSGKYKAVWQRQGGKCAYCGQPMLADQEVDVVERILGRGRRPQNLMYIHRRCAYDSFSGLDDVTLESIDLNNLLQDVLEETPAAESPYLELQEFFRLTDKSPISLSFREIEQILGDQLDWEAYFYTAFWYDAQDGGITTPMWVEEGFPIETN